MTTAVAAIIAVSGCSHNNTSGQQDTTASTTTAAAAANGPAEVDVVDTGTGCEADPGTAAAGNIVFHVSNTGSDVSEFYLLGSDGLTVVGEVENIAAGGTRDLVVRAEQGDYVIACVPGMVGDGNRAPFTVTEGDTNVSSAEMRQLEDAAAAQYTSYVTQQANTLLAATTEFADAYRNGDDPQARALYAAARTYWESIEPVAESFGDLDPRLDLREADLEEDQEWTGWHQIEKQLWPPSGFTDLDTPEERAKAADQLVDDTAELVDRVKTIDLRVDQIGNGAKELLDEVATSKITGEEEIWSHTDLWDFQANVDGARIAYQSLRPIASIKDPELTARIDTEFAALQAALNRHKTIDGYQFYDELTVQEVKVLSDAVNALGEPLSNLTAVVVL